MSTGLEEETMQSCKDIVEVKDIKIDSLRVKRYRGKNFSPYVVRNVKDHIDQIGKMDVRPDDVYITSYPKSGTHWIYEIVNMLLHRTTDYRTGHVFMNFTPMETINNLTSPRILATHLPYSWLPKQLQENKAIKIIHIAQNPKDTCVSFYHYIRKCAEAMYDGEWSGFLDLFIKGDVNHGSWFDYNKDWEEVHTNNAQILFVQYENLIKYLGVASDDNFFSAIERKCSFSQMQKDKVTNTEWTDLTRDGTNYICRKGEIGDWKIYFTVSQNESFDALYENQMSDSTVQFQFV